MATISGSTAAKTISSTKPNTTNCSPRSAAASRSTTASTWPYSTLLAIMGRMATYTGQKVSWEDALNSKEDLSPEKYEWGPIATPEVAVPGVTRLV